MPKFEGRGEFWFPDSPKRIMVGGTTFDPVTGSFLSIDGILDDTLGRPPLHYDIILGRLEDGTSVTLIDCSEMRFEMKPRRIHEFEAGIIIRGEHFESRTEILFKSMKVHFTHLPDWLGLWNIVLHGLPTKFETTRFDYEDFTVTLDADPRVAEEIDSIGYDTIKRMGDSTFVRIQSASGKHYNEFIRIVNGFKELLMFATGKVISPLSLQGSIDDKKSQVSLLDIFYKVENFSSDRVFSPITMLFTYGDISSRFQSFVERWAASHSMLRDVYELYFLSILPPTISSRQRFKNLVNGLECFHRLAFPEQNPECPEDVHRERIERIMSGVSSQEDGDWLIRKLEHSNEISLRKRIRFLMEDDIIKRLVQDDEKDSLLRNVVENRNKFTHRCKFIATDEELDRLNSIVRMILEVRMLRYMDFSSERIEHIIKKNLRKV